MRRYKRVVLLWAFIITSLAWGVENIWEKIQDEFQLYKKTTIHGNSESFKSSLVYQLKANNWLVFSIPENTDKLRVISNLNVKPFLVEPDIEQRWQYAIHYQLLDNQNKVLIDKRYYHSTFLTKYQEKQEKQEKKFNTNYYAANNLIPLDGRLAALNFEQLSKAVKIKVKLEVLEPQAVDASIRIYVPSKIAEHRIGTLWLRMNVKERGALAKGSVYPESLLTETEKFNLLRHQWSPIGPQGVNDRDYFARVLYGLADVGYDQVMARTSFSTELTGDIDHPIVLPIQEVGKVSVEFKELDAELSGDVPITFHWFGRTIKDRWQKNITWNGSMPIELAVEPGLLVVRSAIPLALKAFSLEQLSSNKYDITPELATSYSYYAGSWLDYKVRHVGKEPASIRVDVRQKIRGTDSVMPVVIKYEWLSSQYEILYKGELDLSMTSSLYDRLKPTEDNVQISDPERYYFKLPHKVKYLRIRALSEDVFINIYNQPANLIKNVVINKLKSSEESPSWFVMKPGNVEELMLHKLVQAVSVQPRPPESDADLEQGLYLWEDFLPNQRASSYYILTPYDSNAFRRETLASLYCQIPVNQKFKAKLLGKAFIKLLSPELVFIRAKVNEFKFSMTKNGSNLLKSSVIGKQGAFYLPKIGIGEQVFYLQASQASQWYMNYISDCTGAQYLKRRTFKLNNKSRLTFNVFHQAGINEVFSGNFFARKHGDKFSKIKVIITPEQEKKLGQYSDYNDWTFTQRTYDIKHAQEEGSLVLMSNGRRVNSGESFFIPLKSDLPGGRYRIDVVLQEGDSGLMSLSKLTPGIHAQRKFYSGIVVDD